MGSDLVLRVRSMSDTPDRCFDRCNACRHVHQGGPSGYRCSRCDCTDRFIAPEEPPQ